MTTASFEDLKNTIIKSITGLEIGSTEVNFILSDDSKYRMAHYQNCCEFVRIVEIHGDISDLIDSPIRYAIESKNTEDQPEQHSESFTWTFYRIITDKGSLVIRWLGESNGYYSEAVSFSKLEK